MFTTGILILGAAGVGAYAAYRVISNGMGNPDASSLEQKVASATVTRAQTVARTSSTTPRNNATTRSNVDVQARNLSPTQLAELKERMAFESKRIESERAGTEQRAQSDSAESWYDQFERGIN